MYYKSICQILFFISKFQENLFSFFSIPRCKYGKAIKDEAETMSEIDSGSRFLELGLLCKKGMAHEALWLPTDDGNSLCKILRREKNPVSNRKEPSITQNRRIQPFMLNSLSYKLYQQKYATHFFVYQMTAKKQVLQLERDFLHLEIP